MSTPEIITINSEALEAQIRDLLPSQNGFGSELQASNVIQPIIDLTATAEGGGLPVGMQTASSFQSITAFDINGATNTTIISGTGFFRVFGAASYLSSGAAKIGNFNLFDGSSAKNVFEIECFGATAQNAVTTIFDFVVFMAAGESLRATASTGEITLHGSTRQIATINGTLVNPTGFVAE